MIILASPHEKLWTSYSAFIDEMAKCGDPIWQGYWPGATESPAQFVARLVQNENNPAPGLVCETVYWATLDAPADAEVVGKISLRHALNDSLKEFGGNVGYEVRPSMRRQGIAKEMLRQVLQTQQARALGRVLLTCAPDNIASIKTILANGGVFEKTAFVTKWNRETHYYWITTAP